MAFQDMAALLEYPKGTSARFKRMDAFERLLDGTLYDVFNVPFSQEEDFPGGRYIELLKRRPSVKWNLAKIITDQASRLTFGEAHAPAIRVAKMDLTKDPEAVSAVHETFERIIEILDLPSVMMRAVKKGAAGSVAIVLDVTNDKRPYFKVISGKYCKPFFDPLDPFTIKSMDYIYNTTAEELELAGYSGEYDPKQTYFIKMTYTKNFVYASLPLRQYKYERLGQKDAEDGDKVIAWVKDDERSYTNRLNFFPVWWIKNLQTELGEVDGECTYEAVVDMIVEVTYLMSQIGRGYRYTADPIMAVEEGAMNTGLGPVGGTDPLADSGEGTVKSPARLMRLPAGANAQLLEISAAGLTGAMEHVRLIREYALEVLGGMKSESRDEGGTQSGSALNKMYITLVWLAECFRMSYGTGGFIPLLRMVIRGIEDGDIILDDEGSPLELGAIKSTMALRLAWPEWSTPSAADLKAELEGLATAAGSSPQFPKPILPDDIITTRAAAAVGASDQNRIAAELARQNKAAPPLTPRDAMENTNQESDKDRASQEKQAASRPAPTGSK